MKAVLVSFLLLISMQVFGQAPVTGKVTDAKDNGVLPGATVMFIRIIDSVRTVTVTDNNGAFKSSLPAGNYVARVSFLGFQTLEKRFGVTTAGVNLGNLPLASDTQELKEVRITAKIPTGEQKGDTTQFNAGAFKTAPDASAEDLVQKMPGITVTNGTIQAQGQDVKQVLVDGKRFFGDDPSAALRNLPADVIANIQIFDKKSDQAELSGVDDGNKAKTINIVTKADRRKGQFGKASAAYGSDGKYMVGVGINFFNGDQRLTVTGLTNNINMLDFSVGETPGGGMRGRRPPMGGGTTSGIIATNMIGLNYSDTWGKKIEVSGNYSFTERQISNNQFRVQNFVLPADSGQVYTENNLSSTTTASHQFNLRLDYKINENNRLLITPSVTAQDNNIITDLTGATENVNGALNQTKNNAVNDNTSYTLNNNILYSHRFGKVGRTISASLNTSYSTSDGLNTLLAKTSYANGMVQTRDLSTVQKRTGYSWLSDLTYTEPLGKEGQLQLQYNIGNQLNDADRRTYNLSEQTQSYTLLDTTLSNTFNSQYLTQRVGPGYQFTSDKIRLRFNTKYQMATLQNEQIFPAQNDMNRTFTSVLPAAEFEYKFSKTQNLDFNYSTSTNAPSVDQLQEVIDNTNPLQLTQGNANLDQTYQNNIRMGYRDFNLQTNRVFFVGLFGNVTQNYIANSIVRATNEPITLSNGLTLEEGQQLTRPVNLDGYWNLRSFFHYGLPVSFLKSNFGLQGSLGYTRTPGLNNEVLNYANTKNIGLGISLSSNISEKIDFNVSTNSSYNLVDNSLQAQLNNNYFIQNTNLKYNWIFGKGLVYRTELNHVINSGLSAGYDKNYLLWNMSLSKKLFRDQQGEISLSVNDLLKQNVSVQRNITAQYVEDVQSSVLQRFFMLTFTYNLRNFGGGNAEPATNDKNFPGPPAGGFPGGPPAGGGTPPRG